MDNIICCIRKFHMLQKEISNTECKYIISNAAKSKVEFFIYGESNYINNYIYTVYNLDFKEHV